MTDLHPEVVELLQEASKLEEFKRGGLSLVKAWRPESQEMNEEDFEAVVQDKETGLVVLMAEHDPSQPRVDGLVLIERHAWNQMKESKGLALDMLMAMGALKRQPQTP